MQNQSIDRMKEQVTDLKDAFQKGRQSTAEIMKTAAQGSKEAVVFADSWVHSNAWKLLGAALGLGVMLGFLLTRRSRETDSSEMPR
jgi:ElaB/YqjD/DUF883 family membrane-anchored ribosome-binding protein